MAPLLKQTRTTTNIQHFRGPFCLALCFVYLPIVICRMCTRCGPRLPCYCLASRHRCYNARTCPRLKGSQSTCATKEYLCTQSYSSLRESFDHQPLSDQRTVTVFSSHRTTMHFWYIKRERDSAPTLIPQFNHVALQIPRTFFI